MSTETGAAGISQHDAMVEAACMAEWSRYGEVEDWTRVAENLKQHERANKRLAIAAALRAWEPPACWPKNRRAVEQPWLASAQDYARRTADELDPPG